MSNDEGTGTPPKLKRLLWTGFWLFWVAMIGSSLTRDKLGFWPSMVIFALLIVAVMTPLAVAARREHNELERRSPRDTPDTSA
jgi:hypothetical protein